MTEASHQTVRLSRGRHASPAHGACVMELASMLAGEPFSDRPACVDPVVGAFLRAFNDRLGHRRRQDLYPYAASAVGTAGDRAATRARRERCLAFAGARGLRARAIIAVTIGLRAALHLDLGAGEWAAREAVIRGDHLGFALLDELLGLSEPPALAPAVVDRPQLRVPAL